MAISRKIPKQDELISQLINKGGSVPLDNINDKNKVKLIQLRIEQGLLDQIDNLLNSGAFPKMSRHSWMLFAIKYYLELELNNTKNNDIK